MSLSTNLISGLASGFDWRSVVDDLMAIEYRRVDLITDKKLEYEDHLAEWQSVNSMLLSVKTAAEALSTESAFNVFTSNTTSDTTTAAGDRLGVTTRSSAAPGMYQIKVTNLAQSQKLSSNSYAATDTALSLTAGDILVGGQTVNIVATYTLADVKDKINAANTGSNPSNVTASIVQYGTNDYRLVLTADDTGADGISLLNGSANDILAELGFTDATRTAKNHIIGGDKSDGFTSTDASIKSLLSLSTTQTSALGDIKINIGGGDLDVGAIDLSTDTLDSIKNKFVTAGVDATIITETIDGTNYYRILIEGGSNTYTDNDNILETLGIIKGGVSDVKGVTGDVSNTEEGEYITASTLIEDIDGYSGWAANDYIHLTGRNTSDVAVDDSSFTLGASETVGDLLTKIESVYGNVTASVTAAGKIMVVDNTSGTVLDVEIAVKDNGGAADNTLNFDADDDLGTNTTLREREVNQGEDATILVDGVTVTDASNTLTDVIQGVTLSLVGENATDDTTITLNLERDLSSIKTKINELADAFNTIMGYINTQFTYDDENEAVGGLLFGDNTLSSVKTELINTVTQQITGLPSGYDHLSLIGVSLDLTDTEEGKYDNITLAVDDDELTDALETNFDYVRNLFIAYGSGSSPHLSYISHTSDTQAGTYDVEITQAATQATTTGSAAAVDLTSDETVTIEDWATGRVAEVDLANGSDLDTVINAINSELAKEYTEKLIGDGTNAGVTAATTLDSVGGSDEDVITYYGIRRSGLTVSGSYTISDATTETVGDLLESIEDLFEDDITATLDGSGKLIITATQTGDSQLTFNIDTSAIGSLDFGTVDVDPTGADGSVEGRYAMSITASKTASDELLLTHSSYGTGQRITVSESGGSALSLTSPVYVWGQDVAGTINSISAIGTGQTLTIDNDDNNADGLSISYTGTTTLASATFTLTLGAAELLDRQLGFITDSSDGYVAYKQESLQNSIDSFETQIKDMEASISRKMESMINRFVAMEIVLSQMQSQSQWLTAQISASFSGWWGSS